MYSYTIKIPVQSRLFIFLAIPFLDAQLNHQHVVSLSNTLKAPSFLVLLKFNHISMSHQIQKNQFF